MGLGDERGNYGRDLLPIAETIARTLHTEAFVERGSLEEARRRRDAREQLAIHAAPTLQLLIDEGLLNERALRERFTGGEA